MISAEGMFQHKFNDHGTSKLSFHSHTNKPYEKLKSRSLQSFETQKPLSKKSPAVTRVKSSHPIHIKRRDQILETFIKETEERYKKHVSTSKTHTKQISSSQELIKNANGKSVRFSSSESRDKNGSFKTDTPLSVLSCDSDSKLVSSDEELSREKSDLYSNKSGKNLEKCKSSQNDPKRSPNLRRASTNISPYPENRTPETTEVEHPKQVTIRRSRSYKQAVSAPATQYRVPQSADKSRLKTVLKDLSKRKRQVHLENSTGTSSNNNKNPTVNNQINDDIIKTSQSSIINLTNDPKDKHYSGANVCSNEVEECSDNRNTLIVDYDVNSGHKSFVDLGNNKSNFSKDSLVKSVGSSNDWNTAYSDNTSKVNIRRLHRKQQLGSLDKNEGQAYENESTDFNSKEDRRDFDEGNYIGLVNQNLDRSGKSNFHDRKTVIEHDSVSIHNCTNYENKGISRIDHNSDKTVKINRDCASENSPNDIDPERHSHLSCSDAKQLSENSHVLDNYIKSEKQSFLVRKRSDERESVVLNTRGITDNYNKTRTSSDCFVNDNKYLEYNERNELTIRKTGLSNKGVSFRDNGSINARLSSNGDSQNSRNYFVSREKGILSDKLTPRTSTVGTDVSTPILDKRPSIRQSRLHFDTTKQDINEIKQLEKVKDNNITDTKQDYIDEKSFKERNNFKQVLPNRESFNISKDIKLKSKSHDSFHDKPEQGGASSSANDTVSVASGTVKPPPVASGSTQLTGLSTRSVYLSSKSCVNFAKFDKNDFKAALKKLKVTSNSKSSGSSSSAPQPVITGGKRTTDVNGGYPSTLYEISENNTNDKVGNLQEYHEKCAALPACVVETNVPNLDKSNSANEIGNSHKRPNVLKTRPYLASKPRVINSSGPLPTMKSDNQKSTMQTMPSYTTNPLKMRHKNISTSSFGSTMLKSKSHDTFSRSDKHIDAGLMKFEQPSPQPRRRIGPRAHLQSKSNVSITASMQVDQKPPLDRNQERPKTGRGRRRPISPNEYLPSETESVALFSETCSTVSDQSENLVDENYVSQNFSSFSSMNANPKQSTIPRPKSSKGRYRVQNPQQSDIGVGKSGSIMESAPWMSSQNIGRSRNTTTTVFNMKSMSNTADEYQQSQNGTNTFKDDSSQKPRPKSAKGRARDVNKIKKTQEVDNNVENRDIENQFETAAKHPRPKSSKGRTRNVDVPQDSTSSETVAQANLRPKSAKGKIREGPLPTQSLPSSQFTSVKQQTKTVLSIDSLPSNPLDTKIPLERKQQRRHISSFQNLQSYSTSHVDKQVAQRRPEKYFKPQTNVDVDSGSDSDFGGEIEILDLDDLEDSDDFVVDKPVFINGSGMIDGTMTNSSRSSRGSSDTSAAWDNGNVNHHNNHSKQQMPPRHYDNKSAYDACPPDTPRLTQKEIAIIKSQNYEQINKNNSAVTAAANHNSSSSFAKNNAASTEVEFSNMQTDKKSPMGYSKYDSIDHFKGRLKTSDALKLKQCPNDIHADANSLDEKAISKYRQRVLSNPSFTHDNVQNIASQHMPSNNKMNALTKPRKLKPIYQQQKQSSFKEKLGSNFMTDSYYYENLERNVNNCNASNGIGGANSNSHALLAGIHTKPQKARKNKHKKIEKLTIVHGSNENVENQFDSSIYSDSPGYVTDGSLSFEYQTLMHRRMSDKS